MRSHTFFVITTSLRGSQSFQAFGPNNSKHMVRGPTTVQGENRCTFTEQTYKQILIQQCALQSNAKAEPVCC